MREKMKQARLKKGYTQKQMATFLGFKSKSHYCMIEKGRRGVSVETALKISDILQMPVKELFYAQEVHDTPTNKATNE